MVKNPHAKAGDIRDLGSIPGSGRSPEGGNGNLLQYPWLENSMGLQKSKAHLSNYINLETNGFFFFFFKYLVFLKLLLLF